MIKLDSTNTYRAVAVDLFNDMDKAELTRSTKEGILYLLYSIYVYLKRDEQSMLL